MFGHILIVLIVASINVNAQIKQDANEMPVQLKEPLNSLFASDSVMEITIKGSMGKLLNDRFGKSDLYPIIITYKTDDGVKVSLPAHAKTRGHFRKLKENCIYPPISLLFKKEIENHSSIFKEQVKMKLVMPCIGDEYLVREWLVYKLYNLVAPESYKARLIKVTIEEKNNKKATVPFYGILLEEDIQMASRNSMVMVSRMLKPRQVLPQSFLKMAVFQYLIGNTDWSVEYLQNIKLVATDSFDIPIAVPYDFDHAGIVNAPYAKPAEQLLMNGIRERRYRGYCNKDMNDFIETIAFFNKIKKEVYGVYIDCILLDEKYKKATIKYLDDFYTTINSASLVKKQFAYPCDKNGTGNVIIKGLSKD